MIKAGVPPCVNVIPIAVIDPLFAIAAPPVKFTAAAADVKTFIGE